MKMELILGKHVGHAWPAPQTLNSNSLVPSTGVWHPGHCLTPWHRPGWRPVRSWKGVQLQQAVSAHLQPWRPLVPPSSHSFTKCLWARGSWWTLASNWVDGRECAGLWEGLLAYERCDSGALD